MTLEKQEPLVSIIVPVYNTQDYLVKCLSSIEQQTYKNYEVIIINDGSLDKSIDICNLFCENKRFKVITQKNQGLSGARNKGILNANGKYIMFVDSDDYVTNNFIEEAINDIKKYNSDIVIFDYYQDQRKQQVAVKKSGLLTKEEAMDTLIYHSFAWNKLYKKSLFSKLCFPIGKNYEDIYLIYKLIDRADRISYNSTALYFYITRETSIIKENNLSNLSALYDATCKRFNFWLKNYPKVAKRSQGILLLWALNYIIYDEHQLNDKLIVSAKQNLRKYWPHNIGIRFKLEFYLYKIFPNYLLWTLRRRKSETR